MKRLKSIQPLYLLAAALLLGALLELVGFQLPNILLKTRGPEAVALDLSAYPGYDGTGIPVLPEDGTYSFNDLCIPTQTVTVTVSGTPQTLKGSVSLCDEASAYRTVGAGHFLTNPGGSTNSFTVRLNSHGNLIRLRLTFEAQKDAVTITSVVFNQADTAFSLLRTLLFAAVLFLLLMILKYELYAQTLDFGRHSHKWMAFGALLFCLGISFVLFYECSPSHSYLKPLPTREELQSYQNTEIITDAYAQQLDAFEKGQLKLDLAVNPKLLQLDNLYDKGERDKKAVEYHFDRAFYQGSYYSYFGLAPLFTVYYPVYWLTGMVPTALLCLSALTAFAIVCIFFALNGLLRFFRLQVNLLLYLLGIPALMGGGMLYLLQTGNSFYYYPVLSGLGWLAAFLAFSFYGCRAFAETTATACSEKSCPKKRSLLNALFFFCAGLSVVMIVLSRPNLLLLAIAFVLPAYLQVLLDKNSGVKQKAAHIVPFLIPVLIGALGICWYNQARFGSIFEFGTSYQLTESDIRYNQLTLSFHHFKAMLYHYFTEPLKWQEFFPFLDLSWDVCYDYGNYLYYECNAGLLNLPLNLGIFLLGWTCLSKSRTAALPKRAFLQKATYISALIGILLLGYLDFCLGGIHVRYVADLALAVSLLSLLLILEHVSFGNVKSGQILYGIAAVALLATIMLGFFMAFANESNVLMKENPDFYIKAANFLRNW